MTHKPALLFFLFFLIFFVFALFLMRLFQLTIVRGDYYRRLSEQNRIRELIIEPERGKILDRMGFVLVENLSPDTRENSLRIKSSRKYYDAVINAPIVGYRQLANEADLKNDLCPTRLKLGDKIGKKGVEKVYDCLIRGKSGKKLIEIDAHGKYIRPLTIIQPQNGATIQLALDEELQKKAGELITGKKAAVVALKAKTGEVLVLASSLSYNPQAFEDGDVETITRYLTDKNKPLFNRATEASYPPGSLFKLVLAAGALEEKKIDETTVFEDTGTLNAGPLSFGNWYFLQYGKTDGTVDIVKAIKRSNDIFFYKTGFLLTPEKIKLWAETLGLGKNIDFGLETTSGFVPSPFWKEETLHDRWYLGDTYNLSIGQGYVLTTPLQMAILTSVFANNGTMCQPKLLKNEKPDCQKISISQKTLDLVTEGMKQACASGGTGWTFFDFKPTVACKTGTAESHSVSSLPHAWFTVFAPFDDPQIILTVFLEEAGQGSDVAGPIARDILKTYFERMQ